MINKKILLLLSLIFLLSGCWDKRELNELAITMALGIDQSDDGYKVSAQVVVPSELSSKGGAGHSQIVLFQATGKTLDDALRKLTKESPRLIYPGHLQMLVFGESLAKEGIGKALDFISRNWEVRADFYLVVAKDSTAEEILNVQTPLENMPSNSMFNTLQKATVNNSTTTGIKLVDFIGDLERKGNEPVLTGIIITGDKKSGSNKQNLDSISPSARIKYDGLAIFKEDKLIGWLDEYDTRGYNGITNQVKRAVSTVACPEEGEVNLEIQNYQAKLKSKTVNSSPKLEIKIEVTANVGAVECFIDLRKEETITELEKTFENQIKENIHHTIKTVQNDFNSDVFGFGATIYQQDPKEWKKIQDNWEEEFPNLKVNVDVNVKIEHVGAIDNSFLQNMKD
ncbi:Ger(x)C family spore germination protein [Psychrobacillus sp. OK032]|uniref:Ger(x)C family spore germination protein n=1 Tax=Psychrobacillus sp. OK032 TaxID=1884358 RepID=UPI0008AB96CD|nr:Ger(x)C family spore germination protein [Psychrobacillus sp. OK032]SES10940.1 spore germination protein KC [Psychrobacillus sp. OK032]